MRAWYVFVVVGLILSAGMVTYGVMIEHQADQNVQAYLTHPAVPAPPKQVHPPAPIPTTTPAPAPTPVQTPVKPLIYHLSWGNSKENKFAIPKNYYHYPFKKCRPTYANLIRLLDGLKCPHRYNQHTFKCSHYAAWLEWYLENHGFRTDIVAVYWNYDGKTFGHAFDRVYTTREVIYVDPTRLAMGFHGKQLIMLGPTEPVSPGGKLTKIEVAHNIYQAMHLWGYYSIDWWDVLGYPPKVN